MRWVAMVGLTGCALVDGAPPTMAVAGPEGVVSAASFTINASDDGAGLQVVEVAIDGGEPVELSMPPSGPLTWAPELEDGAHSLSFVARDRSWFGNEVELSLAVQIDQTPPELEIAEGSLLAAQGRTWALWVRSSEPVTEMTARAALLDHTGEVMPWSAPLYSVHGAWRSLRGMEIKQEPGAVALTVEAVDEAGNRAMVEVPLVVRETAFEKGGFIRLTKKQKRARKDQEAIDRMREERNTAYATVLPESAWAGPWQRPVVDSRLTSPFGKYRSYSDGRKSYHTGLDLDQKRGAPVLAAAPGTVLVAGEQAIFGNVVIVNHGHGVASSYNHLDAISVAVGDVVSGGDVLGALGSTGQSTGPHLHWGLEVGVVAVDPSEWLDTGFDESPFAD